MSAFTVKSASLSRVSIVGVVGQEYLLLLFTAIILMLLQKIQSVVTYGRGLQASVREMRKHQLTGSTGWDRSRTLMMTNSIKMRRAGSSFEGYG